MDDLGDVESRLAEADRKVAAYQSLLEKSKELEERLREMETRNARLDEAMLMRNAKEFVVNELSRSQLPEPTRKRLVESLVINPPLINGTIDQSTYAVRVREAMLAETAYLSEVAGYGNGQIVGMGGGVAFVDKDVTKTENRLKEAFGSLGLNEHELKYAVRIQ